jgi:hypothetical protein
VLEREGAGQNGNNSAGGSSSSVGGGAGEGGGGEAAANELPAWFSKPQLDRPPTPEVSEELQFKTALTRRKRNIFHLDSFLE